MTEINPIPVEPVDDPKKPYKMYAAIAGTFVGTMGTYQVVSDNPWAVAIGGSIVAALSVYIKGNPIINVPARKNDSRKNKNSPQRNKR